MKTRKRNYSIDKLKIAVLDTQAANINILCQILRSKGIKKIERFINEQKFQEYSDINELDIIFLENDLHGELSGVEFIDELIFAKKLSPHTRIIFISPLATSLIYTADHPFQISGFVDKPYGAACIQKQLEQHLWVKNTLSDTFSDIENSDFKAAFFKLKSLKKIRFPTFLKNIINRILINLLIELGEYKIAESAITPFCNEAFPWALWSLFYVNHELGHLEKCAQFLQTTHIKNQYPNRVFYWQIFLALESKDFETVRTLLEEFPAVNMPPILIRLCTLIFIILEDFELAIDFLTRKRRILAGNKIINQFLTISLMRVYLYQALIEKGSSQVSLIAKAQECLNSIQSSAVKSTFLVDFEYINLLLSILKKKDKTTAQQLTGLNSKWQDSKFDPSICALKACVNHIGGDENACFELIYRGNCEFSDLVHSARRIYSSLLQKFAFNFIYKEQQQADIYNQLGRRHFIDRQYKLATKMFFCAISLNADNKNYKINIQESMKKGKIKEYLGIKVEE